MSTDAYHDWWYHHRELTADELKGIERRMKQRGNRIVDPQIESRVTARLSPVPMEAKPLPKKPAPKESDPVPASGTCEYCGVTFLVNPKGKRRMYCSNSCRAKANHRKARGVLPIRAAAREAS